MENIESMVNVLHMFGQGLGCVKTLIGEIEKEIMKQTNILKKSMEEIRQQSADELSFKEKSFEIQKIELENRVAELKNEIMELEKEKEHKLQDNTFSKISLSNLSSLSYESVADVMYTKTITESKNSTSQDDIHLNQDDALTPEDSVKDDFVSADNWWELDKKSKDEGKDIDWTLEYENRNKKLLRLTVRTFPNRSLTQGDVFRILRSWIGRLVNWTMLPLIKRNMSQLNIEIEFPDPESRQIVYDMQNEIRREGLIYISESLTYVERKEKKRMFTMATKLRAENRKVECQDRKICVDGVWWKYCWSVGWKKA